MIASDLAHLARSSAARKAARGVVWSLAVLLALGLGGARAQTDRAVGGEAKAAMRQATLAYEQIKSSNLEPWWRGNAAARMMRGLVALRDIETARTLARDAVADLSQQQQTQPPPALSSPALYAVLAQGYSEIPDAEATREVSQLAEKDIDALPDPELRATLASYLALARLGVNDRAGAEADVLRGLKSAAAAPVGRGRVAALGLAALAQARLGQHEAAKATLDAAKASLAAVVEPLGRAIGAATLARASATNGDLPDARALLQDAQSNYARLGNDVPPTNRIRALELIIEAQIATGDRGGAARGAQTLQQLAQALQNPFERCLGFLELSNVLVKLSVG